VAYFKHPVIRDPLEFHWQKAEAFVEAESANQVIVTMMSFWNGMLSRLRGFDKHLRTRQDGSRK
jgi:hypothetical protein